MELVEDDVRVPNAHGVRLLELLDRLAQVFERVSVEAIGHDPAGRSRLRADSALVPEHPVQDAEPAPERRKETLLLLERGAERIEEGPRSCIGLLGGVSQPRHQSQVVPLCLDACMGHRASAGGAQHRPRGQRDGPSALALNGGPDEVQGRLSDRVVRLSHCGNSGVATHASADVVESRHSHGLGHGKPSPAELADRGDRVVVGRGDDSVWLQPGLREERVHGARAVDPIEVAVVHEGRVVGDAVAFQRFAIPRQSLHRFQIGRHASDERDPSSAVLLDEVGDQLAHSRAVVD